MSKPTAAEIAKAQDALRGTEVGQRLTDEQAAAQQTLSDAGVRRDDH